MLFNGLDAQYEAAVETFTSTTIIVSHKAFGYYVNDYGLTQIAISGLDTDGEADSQTVANIITYINENNISTVFYQEYVSVSIASAIVNETNAELQILSTLESLSQEEIDAGEDYLSIMAQNLIAITGALS